MNILHIIDGFKLGGIETQALEIIDNFPKRGNENYLFNISPEIKDLKKQFTDLLINKKLQKIEELKTRSTLILTFKIFFFCKKNKIESLIIYPCNKRILPVILGAKLAGINNIFVHIGNTINSHKRIELVKIKILFKLLVLLEVFFVPASESIRKSLISSKIQNPKIAIINNSCAISKIKRISDISRTKYQSNKINNIIMIARLDLIKDQATLLKAFSRLKYPDWKLKIIGKGHNYKFLENLSLDLNLDPYEIFVGSKTNIAELLGEAEIFAFSTTESEGFGKVLIEAMAANLPILASDVSACREVLLEGKGGLLIPPGDVDAWEKSLIKVINNISYRNKLKENLRNLVKIYDSKKIAKDWETLLKKNK